MRCVLAVITAALVLAIPTAAIAQDSAAVDPSATPTKDPAQRAMESYFAGEKTGGMVLVGLGAAGLIAGGVLITRDSPTAKGMSYPILGLGLLHAAAGIYVYVASNGRIGDFQREIQKDSSAWVARESVRIDGVHTQFFALKVVEGILIATGGALALIGHVTDRDELRGVGIGLAIEATATLGFDIWAAQRAKSYDAELQAITVTVGQAPATGESVPMLSFVKRF